MTDTTKHTSASGKYTLEVSSISTRPGCWNVTRGVVRRGQEEIATVDRNYSAFPHLFIEGHPDGHDYLVCGADYQGQTVIQLDTGERREAMSPGADKGHGFCWAEYRFDVPSCVLVVAGCIWAGPYEYRFYQFSSPMDGWPAIEVVGEGPDWEAWDGMVWEDPRWPEIKVLGITSSGFDLRVRTFQTEEKRNEEGDAVEEGAPTDPIASIALLRSDGAGNLRFIEEWASEAEKERRHERAVGQAKFARWKEKFLSSDPLYLAYVAGVEQLKKILPPELQVEDHESYGVTFDDWGKGSDYKGRETRWCRRLVQMRRDKDGVLHLEKGPVVDLEWAVETGPIKLQVHAGGKRETKFFEHSPAGMAEAFALAERAAGEGP
jgi:hypothetical protein